MNTSIAQIHAEIKTAKRQALIGKKRRKNERSDKLTGSIDYGEFMEAGNSLSDIIVAKRRTQQSGVQSIAPALKEKIESLYVKFPFQYKYLGLYHAAGFTTYEIAAMHDTDNGSITKTLQRAVKRLQKGLTEEEYNSIRWALGEPLPLQATPRIDDSEYENCRPYFLDRISFPKIIAEPITGLHPPEKNLPTPRCEAAL